MPKKLTRKQAFDQLAKNQRNVPEAAMNELSVYLPGVLGFVVEHTGDLTHRMAENSEFLGGQYGIVKNKVDKVLVTLENAYGFRREVYDNMVSKAEYDSLPIGEVVATSKGLMRDYAEAHSALVVYNEVQALARDAAIALGEGRFEDATQILRELKAHLDAGPEHWAIASRVYFPFYEPEENPSQLDWDHPEDNPRRRRQRRDQCYSLSNKKMDRKVYKERRLIIDQIYRINDLIAQAGLPPPPFVGVRICEKHSRIAGVARLGQDFIWIPESSLKLPPNQLKEVVLHELAHAVLGSEHDENCPLMGAVIGNADIPELERAFLDLYAEKVATGWVPKPRRRRNPKVPVYGRHRAAQKKYLDEAIEAFEDFLNKQYQWQYEYETEGDGLDEYDFLLSEGGWDLKDYYTYRQADHQYTHDDLIDLIIRYVENGPYSYEDLEKLIIDRGEGSLYDLKWHEGTFGTYPFTIYSVAGGELEVHLSEHQGDVVDPITGKSFQVDDIVDFYAKTLTPKELEKVNADLYVSDLRIGGLQVGYINRDGHYAWVADPEKIEEELDEKLEDLADDTLEKALKDPNLDPELKQLIIDELDERNP